MADKEPEVIIDFSQVRPFEPLDPGLRYLCATSKLELTKSAEGNPMAALELTVMAPDEVQVENWAEDKDGLPTETTGMKENPDGSPVMTKAKGRKLFRNYSLLPQALPFLHEYLKAVDPEVVLDEKFRFNPKKYVGLQCAVRIRNEAFEEQVRARVQKIYPAVTAT